MSQTNLKESIDKFISYDRLHVLVNCEYIPEIPLHFIKVRTELEIPCIDFHLNSLMNLFVSFFVILLPVLDYQASYYTGEIDDAGSCTCGDL